MGKVACREAEDLLLAIAVILVVAVIWLAGLGWRPELSPASNDALLHTYHLMNQLSDLRGDWTRMIYRPSLLGGFKLHEVNGTLPISQWLASAGLSAHWILVLTMFFIQVCYGYLGARTALDLSALTADSSAKPSAWNSLRWPVLCTVAICAFSPILGWRLAYGHAVLLAGFLIFPAALCLAVTTVADRLSFTSICFILLALTHAFPSQGQQMIIYSTIFGGPILLAIALSPPVDRPRRVRLVAATLLGVTALILALPRTVGMIANALSTDSSRSLDGARLIYSYIPQEFFDWVVSFFLTAPVSETQDIAFQFHEKNYPVGPLLLALFLFPWKRFPRLGSAAILSTLCAVALSLNIKPLSSWLLMGLPILEAFRVPARAILPVLWLALLAGCAALLGRSREQAGMERPSSRGAAIAAVFLLVSFFSGWVGELLAWAILAYWVIDLRKNVGGKNAWIPLVALTGLAILQVSAFKQRLLPFEKTSDMHIRLRELGGKAIAQSEELANPLNRAQIQTDLGRIGKNAALSMGLSSLEGYSIPSRRFSELVSAIYGQPYDPTRYWFSFAPENPAAQTLFHLYNVKYQVNVKGADVSVSSLKNETLGTAWFPAQIDRALGFQDLGFILRESAAKSAKLLLEKLWVLQSDEKVQEAALPISLPAICKQSKIKSLSSILGGQEFKIGVEVGAACPLVIAMNYSESIRADGIDLIGRRVKLNSFPAYGSLQGVWVSPFIREVHIRTVGFGSSLLRTILYSIAGVFFLAFAIVHFRRRAVL